MASSTDMFLPLSDASTPRLNEVGGKAASLINLLQAGFNVPDGFVLSTGFFRTWIETVTSSQEWREVCDVLQSAQAHEIITEELNALCTELKRLVSDLALTSKQSEVLSEITRNIDEESVAVRSSSPEEDLTGASFAGLYETILNVTSQGLEPAVRKCFESCLDARVLIYKRQMKFKVIEPRIAVVVQKQIESEVSGVAFSLNPLTNDFDEAVINASWGLGDALVSGELVPDSFVVDKVTREAIESRAGDKGGDRSDVLCLNTSQLIELTEVLCEIERHYDEPVDVEWAFSGAELHILQARPITTYIPLDKDMQTEPGERRILYIDPSLADGLTIGGAISPLTLDLFRYLIDLGLGYLLDAKELDHNPKTGVIGIGGARLYANFSNVLHLFDPKKVADVRRLIDTTLADIYETLDVEKYRAEKPPSYLTVPKVLLAMPKILWRFRGFARGMMRAVFKREVFDAEYNVGLLQFEKDLAAADFELPVSEFVKQIYIQLAIVSMKTTAPALLVFVFFGTDSLDKLIDNDSAEQRRLIDMIKAGADDLVLEMGMIMYELSTLLPASEFEDLDQLANKIDQRALPEAFLSLWDDFVKRFGCRGALEMDLANPKYADDPLIALRQIGMIARGNSGFDPREVHAKHLRERQAAYAKLLGILKGRKRRRLQRCFKNIVQYERSREMPKHHMTMVNKLIRERVLKQADELVAAGRLEHRDEVFELRFDDLDRADRDTDFDLREIIKTRNQFYHKAKAQVRNFPHAIDSRGRIIRPIKPGKPGELTGMAVSSGVIKGPVKVMHDPFEKEVAPGDILVAYTTDPGWTPLFINAAAILLEIGGQLQHGALVAREYGKPCVAGIVNVTTELTDGQMIEVDGDAGVVRILG